MNVNLSLANKPQVRIDKPASGSEPARGKGIEPAEPAAEAPQDSAVIGQQKPDPDSPETTMKSLAKLAKKAKAKGFLGAAIGAGVGAAAGVAGGVVGGLMGAVVGTVSAPVNGLIGAVAGGIAGGKIGIDKYGDIRALFAGLGLGFLGALAGGTAGFYGSAALATVAGIGSGAAAAAAGAAALAPAGAAIGQIGGMAQEYAAHKEQYPGLEQKGA